MASLARSLFLGVAVVSTLLAAGVHASDRAVEFGQFDVIAPIGEGAVDPRPADGEILLLQFWASWCHSCGSLMWDIDEIVSRSDGVKYVAVSLDDEPSAAAGYIRKHKLYTKYADRYFIDTGKALSTSLGVETVPSILLVSGNGDVLLSKSGHLNSSDLGDIVAVIRNLQ